MYICSLPVWSCFNLQSWFFPQPEADWLRSRGSPKLALPLLLFAHSCVFLFYSLHSCLFSSSCFVSVFVCTLTCFLFALYLSLCLFCKLLLQLTVLFAFFFCKLSWYHYPCFFLFLQIIVTDNFPLFGKFTIHHHHQITITISYVQTYAQYHHPLCFVCTLFDKKRKRNKNLSEYLSTLSRAQPTVTSFYWIPFQTNVHFMLSSY